MHLIHRAFFGDEDTRVECLMGFQLADGALPRERDQTKPPIIEYSTKEVESTWTHIEVFAKHS